MWAPRTSGRTKVRVVPSVTTSHQSVKMHVSRNEAACKRNERALVRCAEPPFKQVSETHRCILSLSLSLVTMTHQYDSSRHGEGIETHQCILSRLTKDEVDESSMPSTWENVLNFNRRTVPPRPDCSDGGRRTLAVRPNPEMSDAF